ncbi:MAG: hypothetical protein M3R25_09080 [Bacteroidota bacterium]|nr:hypothetical protein [Bacteroidota bacterium]
MERVSSQLTIFIRIALPTMWLATVISLFVLLTIAVRGKAQVFTNPIVWVSVLIILLSGLLFIYFILWKIYRVDMDARHIYVSNYFKTYKYPFTDVESIIDSSFLPGRIFKVTFKSKGSFGQQIYFLASQKLWLDFINEHPDMFAGVLRHHA